MRFTTRDDPPAQPDQRATEGRILSARGDVVERAEQPQADRYISACVVTDLVERRGEQLVKTDPRDACADDPGQVVEHRFRQLPGREADEDPAQLVYAVDRRGGIVHGGGNRFQGDVDDLQYAVFDV